MANTLDSSVTLSATFTFSKPNTGFNDTTITSTKSNKQTLKSSNGASSAKGADQVYSAVRSLAGGANETLDLSGSLTNIFGETISFVRIKAILIELLSTAQDADNGTAATSILVGGAATNQALAGSGKWFGDTSDKIRVFNGGFFACAVDNAAGVTVANASTDSLKVENEDGAVTAKYRLTIIGGTT